MTLEVDRRWCAACAICRDASQGRVRFDDERYPLAGAVQAEAVEHIRRAVERCPARALRLS